MNKVTKNKKRNHIKGYNIMLGSNQPDIGEKICHLQDQCKHREKSGTFALGIKVPELVRTSLNLLSPLSLSATADLFRLAFAFFFSPHKSKVRIFNQKRKEKFPKLSNE